MATTKPIDYDALYDDLMRVCLGPEYYSALEDPMELIATPITATTLDEYLMLLRKGYINVDIRPELGKHLKELLEDDWLLQWPAVRCLYAENLLYPRWDKNWPRNWKKAIEIQEPLAKEGWPCAMTSVACCWFNDSDLGPKNPNRGICLILEASRKGYSGAQRYLTWEYRSGHYKRYCEEIQMFLIYEAMMAFLVDRGVTKENCKEKLNESELKELEQMKRKGQKLEVIVTERAFLRTTTSDFLWPKDEGPYEIDFQSIMNGQI